jgi:hypothetical protein
VPEPPVALPPPLAVPPQPEVDDADDDEPTGRRRGLIHHLLDHLP